MYTKKEDIGIFGPLESEDTLLQAITCNERAEKTVLMADHHLGYAMPVGGVAAYKDYVSVSGVGYDISCGVAFARLNIDPKYVKTNISKIMDMIQSKISFGVGRVNTETVDHELFEDPTWEDINSVLTSMKFSKAKAQAQLGTVGSGNHYVDVFVDELNRIWIGVHFGSRGLGHKIATYFVKTGGGKDGIMVEPVLLHEKSDLGEQYIKGMQLAGKYAYAGRDWVCSTIAKELSCEIVEKVHNHHNYAWKEFHEGVGDVWVVRKGATPAFPGQLCPIGGSMGDNSYILRGIDSDLSKKALYSTIHGAGRVMGRKEAAGSYKWKRLEEGKPKVKVKVREGKVTPEMMNEWIFKVGVELRGGGLDESPHAYKRIDDVLGYHKGTVEVVHTLRPLGVCMAGANELDPYKD